MTLNPGAVRHPKLGWGAWTVTHHPVAYDLERMRSAFLGSGLLDEA